MVATIANPPTADQTVGPLPSASSRRRLAITANQRPGGVCSTETRPNAAMPAIEPAMSVA